MGVAGVSPGHQGGLHHDRPHASRWQRRPVDSGQFRARKFHRTLAQHDLVGSMGQVASAAANAAMESFFSLLKKNVLDRQLDLRFLDVRGSLRAPLRATCGVADADRLPLPEVVTVVAKTAAGSPRTAGYVSPDVAYFAAPVTFATRTDAGVWLDLERADLIGGGGAAVRCRELGLGWSPGSGYRYRPGRPRCNPSSRRGGWSGSGRRSGCTWRPA